jgi:methyl-accepting chemotaxis protein
MLDNVKLGKKFIGGYLAVSTIALIIGIMGISSTARMKDMVDDMYARRLNTVAYAESVAFDFADMRGNVVALMLSDNEKRLRLYDNIAENKQNVDKNLTLLDAIMEPDQTKAIELMRGLRERYTRLTHVVNKVMEASRSDTTTEEAVALMIELETASDDAAQYTADLVEYSLGAAREASVKSDSDYRGIRGMLIILLIVGITLGLLLGYYLANSMSKPLAKAVNMLKDLNKGKLDTRLKMSRGDEIGIMAMTMDSFADNLQNAVVGTLKQISNGDLSAKVVSNGADDEISPALKGTIEALRGLIIEDGGKVLQSAAGKDLTQRLSHEYRGEFDG